MHCFATTGIAHMRFGLQGIGRKIDSLTETHIDGSKYFVPLNCDHWFIEREKKSARQSCGLIAHSVCGFAAAIPEGSGCGRIFAIEVFFR